MQRFRHLPCLALCVMGTALLVAQQRQTSKSQLYSDEDLLPHARPQTAPTMLLPLFVRNRAGIAPRQFTKKDFVLTVDGRPTKARVMRPWDEGSGPGKRAAMDHVLLVLPPNQPLLHNMATADAIRYFSEQQTDGQDRLAWDVSLFDSNGKQTQFTRNKRALLAELEASRKAVQPLEPDGELGGTWLDDARSSISRMRFLSGRKIVIAFNPQLEPVYGLLEYSLMQTDPSDMVGAAERAGAQVYIANSTGPAYAGPGGNGLNTALFGMQTANLMQTSGMTGAGYANTLKNLFGQILGDRAESYVLKFNVDPYDLDDTSFDVKVRILDRNLKAVVLRPFPDPSSNVRTADAPAKERVPRPLMEALKKTIASPDLGIAQHIDYFPERMGAAALLPFSCALIWIGDTHAPHRLIIVERIEQAESGFVVSSHKLTLLWNGRFASWERDNKLSPGSYRWRIAVGNGAGKVLASAITETKVPKPNDAAVQMSTLVTGMNCRRSVQDKAQSMYGLRRRGVRLQGAVRAGPMDASMDPLLENECLLEPNPTLFYTRSDVLRALVRIYLSGKVDKGNLDAWDARFELLDQTGRIEAEQRTSLTVDSAPGYLAAIQFPLGAQGITRGMHFVKFRLRGPRAKKPLARVAAIMIQ